MRDGPPEPLAARQLAVRRFTASLIAEGHVVEDPFRGVKAPKIDQPIVEPLTDDELRALIKACAALGGIHGTNFTAPGERLHHRSDEAIVRLMFEIGIRTGEVVALEIGDLDLVHAWSMSVAASVGSVESSQSGRPPSKRPCATTSRCETAPARPRKGPVAR